MSETPAERAARRAERRARETPEEREARHERYRQIRRRRRRTRKWKRRAKWAPVVLAGVGVVGFSGYVLASGRDAEVAADPSGESTYRSDVFIGSGDTEEVARPAVLFVGDSFTGGSAMNDGPTWPRQIADREEWIDVIDAVGGTGFVRGSTLGQALEVRLDDLLRKYDPDGIVVAMGLNDSGNDLDEVAETAHDILGAMQDRWPGVPFVVLSPFSPKEIPAVTELDAKLEPAVQDLGLPYVDVTDVFDERPQLIGADGTHPTDAGHAYLSRYIDKRLRLLGFMDDVAAQAADGM